MKPNHVMIHLETMGLVPGSAIVSIGAVIFDPRMGKVTKNTFYRELDWEAQERAISPNTLEWWGSLAPAAKTALDGLESLSEALVDLSKWLPRDCKPWGNGAGFDITMLEDAYRQCDIEIPWKFWNVRDCRTIKDMYESARGGYDKKVGGVLRHALDDAVLQAQYVCEMWRSILAGEGK